MESKPVNPEDVIPAEAGIQAQDNNFV